MARSYRFMSEWNVNWSALDQQRRERRQCFCKRKSDGQNQPGPACLSPRETGDDIAQTGLGMGKARIEAFEIHAGPR